MTNLSRQRRLNKVGPISGNRFGKPDANIVSNMGLWEANRNSKRFAEQWHNIRNRPLIRILRLSGKSNCILNRPSPQFGRTFMKSLNRLSNHLKLFRFTRILVRMNTRNLCLKQKYNPIRKNGTSKSFNCCNRHSLSKNLNEVLNRTIGENSW